MDEDYYTVAELAAIVGVRAGTISGYMREGRIKGVREVHGRRATWRIPALEAERWLQWRVDSGQLDTIPQTSD